MNWRRWINKDNETLFDLIFGCIVYSIVFEAIGLLVVENKGSYVQEPEQLSCDDGTSGEEEHGI